LPFLLFSVTIGFQVRRQIQVAVVMIRGKREWKDVRVSGVVT
jgi:hypothetical protein